MQHWLLAAGMLRRNAKPSAAELRELLPAAAPRLACPECGSQGLAVRDDDELGDWPAARRCQSCGRAIPPERLEVFPDAELCVACQRGEDQGVAPATGDYCPRCGSPMMVRPSRGRGIARQELACSDPSCCGG
jgi:predicted RNA-binding Zn-ribbon protein involved in translation (DUF1610 family)